MLPAVFPLLREGFFVTDDAEWMIIRFSAFHEAFRDGQFPVRFLGRLNHGFGYPAPTFLYPGFMYIAEIFHLLGVEFLESIKMVILFSIVLSGIFTFFWLRKFFTLLPSFIGAIVYVYSPYHLYDVYVRGSVGEVLAIAVLPFILWQIERKSVFWTALSIGLLILSHNILAAMFVPLIVAYMILDWYVLKKTQTHFFIQTVFFGLGISSFFWIPALTELRHTVFLDTNISDWSRYFADINLIGTKTLAVLLFALISMVSKKISIKKHRLSVFFFIVGTLVVFMSSVLSMFIWKFFPVQFIQFPYRFLSIALISTAFLMAVNITVLTGVRKKFFIGLVVVILAIPFFARMRAIEFIDKGNGFYATNNATTTIHDEYMPVWVKEIPMTGVYNKVEIINGDGGVKDLIVTNDMIKFTTDIKSTAVARVNTIYWPGWKVSINQVPADLDYSNKKGVMDIKVPRGLSVVELTFDETLMRMFANTVSMTSMIFLILIALINKKNKFLLWNS